MAASPPEAGHPARPQAFLYLEDGQDIFRVHLDRPRMLLGRGEDNDITIRDDSVDEYHAVIYWASGHYILSVVSKNQGVVNGKVIEGPRRLYNGDVIDLGGNVMTFIKMPRVSDTVVQLGIWGPSEVPWFALINRPIVTLGHKDGDIRLPDEFVGSPHCVIENFCAGALYLVNRDRERGTKINGTRILQRKRLHDGDVLTLGATQVAVRVQPSSALPAPTELVPLQGVERAQVRQETGDDSPEDVEAPWQGKRRTVGEIMDDVERSERGEFMREVVHDFESEDEEDVPYYLPEHEEVQAPSAMDGRLDGEVESGITMMIPMDKAGRHRKVRYYMPDTQDDRDSRRHADKDETLETRQDVPTVGGSKGTKRKRRRPEDG